MSTYRFLAYASLILLSAKAFGYLDASWWWVAAPLALSLILKAAMIVRSLMFMEMIKDLKDKS